MNASIKTAAGMQGIPVAAIIQDERGVADDLLAEFAFALRHRGRRVHGLVQQRPDSQWKASTVLIDLDARERFPLFQNLGTGSVSCGIDETSVAAASGVLRRALREKADLAIANRFGALEAIGRGLAAEMLALMSERIPLLTVVATPYLDDWRRFTGGAGVQLAPNPQALEAWFAGLEQSTDHR